MPKYFPSIPDGVFAAIRQIQRLVAGDPDFLNDSPYPEDFVKLFKPKASSLPETNTPLSFAEIEIGDFEVEAEDLFKYIKGLKPSEKELATKEGIDWTKAMTSLLEKLLSIKERAAKLKDVAAFEAAVVEFMQDILTPAQRTQFMDKIANV